MMKYGKYVAKKGQKNRGLEWYSNCRRIRTNTYLGQDQIGPIQKELLKKWNVLDC